MTELPGGFAVGSRLARDYAFRTLDGALELALADAVRDGEPLPAARVSRALCATLAVLGGRPADRARIDALCVGDRQFLVRELAAHVGVEGSWLSADCTACGARFDFFVDPARLPVKPAGPGYPYVDVDTSLGRCRFRVPTGADQQAVARLDARDAVQALLRRCLVDADSEPDADAIFSDADRDAIDAALEATAPEVAVEAAASCPDCGTTNVLALSPYAALDVVDGSILEDIHALAWHYHWSEAEILALPRARRRRYLTMIDRARGASGAVGQRETWDS